MVPNVVRSTIFPKKIGLLGGMGPHASAFVLRRLFEDAHREFGAHNNSDFPAVVVSCLPVTGLLDQSTATLLEDVTNHLLTEAHGLARMGAEVFAVLSMTMHAALPSLSAEIDGQWVSFVDATAHHLRATGSRRVALFSTTNAEHWKVFSTTLQRYGIEVQPLRPEQATLVAGVIERAIARPPSTDDIRLLSNLATDLAEVVDAVVLACTDLAGLSLHPAKRISIVDATSLGVRALLDASRNAPSAGA